MQINRSRLSSQISQLASDILSLISLQATTNITDTSLQEHTIITNITADLRNNITNISTSHLNISGATILELAICDVWISSQISPQAKIVCHYKKSSHTTAAYSIFTNISADHRRNIANITTCLRNTITGFTTGQRNITTIPPTLTGKNQDLRSTHEKKLWIHITVFTYNSFSSCIISLLKN
jgi:hypothetical protein